MYKLSIKWWKACRRLCTIGFSAKLCTCWYLNGLRNVHTIELHDKSHVIVMRISSVKPLLWLVVNLPHVLSDGAAFNTQSRSSLTSYSILRWESPSIMNAILRSLSVNYGITTVLNAAPSESTWGRFTTNHRSGFTDEMRMTIACDFSCNPSILCLILLN